MKGFVPRKEISDEDLDKIIRSARKNGSEFIIFSDPDDNLVKIKLEMSNVDTKQGFVRLRMDLYSTNFDITPKGQDAFEKKATHLPDQDDIDQVFSGKRVIRMDVRETGEPFILSYMLVFLEDSSNFQKI